MAKKKSNPLLAFFLVIIFGIIGSIIVHILYHDKDKELVKAAWIVGILFTLGAFYLLNIYQEPGVIDINTFETPSYETTTPSTEEIPDTTPKEWYKVKEFSGTSNRVTDTFSIKGSKWRFTWECTEDTRYGTGFGGMNIFATPIESEYTLIGESIFMGKCKSPDTTYVHEGPGSYYLDIDVANVISWTVLVEDYY